MSTSYPVAGGSKRKVRRRRKKRPREQMCTQQWDSVDFGYIREEVRRLHNFSDNLDRMKMDKAKEMGMSSSTMSTAFVLLLIGIVGVTVYGFTQIFRAVYTRYTEI